MNEKVRGAKYQQLRIITAFWTFIVSFGVLPFRTMAVVVLIANNQFWEALVVIVVTELPIGFHVSSALLLSYFFFKIDGWIVIVAVEQVFHGVLLSYSLRRQTQNVHEELFDKDLGVLSESFDYKLEEIPDSELPERSYYGFDQIEKFMKKIPMTDPMRAKSLRVFIQKDTGNYLFSSALAFPVMRGSSIIILRKHPKDMSLWQKYELHHELAHCSFLGQKIIMRSFKWPFILNFIILGGVFITCITGVNFNSLGFLFVYFYAYKNKRTATEFHVAHNEVFADSVALSHPIFEDSWMQIIQARIEIFETNLKELSQGVKSRMSEGFQSYWLGLHLKRGRIYQYIPMDNNLWSLLTAFFAGLTAYGLREVDLHHWLFNIIVILVLLGALSLGLNAKKTHFMLMHINETIDKKLES